MSSLSNINFPVIRGVQAGREYYVAMWTLRMLSQISIFNEKELPPELRAQRILNKGRIPELSGYVLDNPEDYVFSGLTASIDADVEFEALEGGEDRLGILKVPMEAKFIINDGQHRRAAILKALEEKPELAYESIAVVFYLDQGLARSQQMFTDLNRHAIRPSRSISILYDQRDEKALLAKAVVMDSSVFRDIVDMEKSSLAPRSRCLFTLSAFYNACADLVQGLSTGDVIQDAEIAREFWESVAKQLNLWLKVKDGYIAAGELREGYIHSHGIGLHALGRAGNALLKKHPKNWKSKLRAIKTIDWSKKNLSLWEGRALIGGKVSKATTNVTLTVNVIKNALELELSPAEQKAEDAYNNSQIITN
jgi:DNA sulfur modification protein DndB